ncbi:DUF4290 domain-containing protein [Apibacter muscae]|uniref:DUF4290 domain-containing protein n=1 Tax=Apibacter muscae TaxID=2509004 RepID=A0A563D9X3_9FLAO|nr:DUF4290 domain-containing protein [Apibacter muscae]TWP26743.1 DUF4290 domain-containing protein [Apibacter muscae]TWP27626.1 DUF4290 domain-containing protein [Apibacter muscae]
MEYNTQRTKLIIPEYGRYIQALVNHCLNIENNEDRNKFARSIIKVMGDLNPHLRDIPDFQHKLWDQLFIMSEFKLKVDSPYPIISKAEIQIPPKKMEYPKNESKFRYYGTNIKKMIEVAKTWEEGDRKEGLKYVIANQMKKNYLKWNKDQVEDSVIFSHLEEMSEGNLKSTEGDPLMTVVNSSNANTISNNSKNRNRNSRNNNFKNKVNYSKKNSK